MLPRDSPILQISPVHVRKGILMIMKMQTVKVINVLLKIFLECGYKCITCVDFDAKCTSCNTVGS
jgi:hypothetical protein